MATTFEKIQTLLGRVKKNKEHKFYAESTLDDGRVIVTEDDALDVGVVVQVLENDGTSYPLEEGEYVLADGTVLVITGDGVVASMGGAEGDVPSGAIKRKKDKKIAEEKAKDVEKKKPAEKSRIPGKDSPLPPRDAEKAPPKEAEKKKFETIEEEVYEEFEEIKDEERAKEIIEFISTKLEEYIEETEEEEEEEIIEMENEKVEFSSVVGDLMTRIDELETKLSNIEKSPAEEGITLNPAGTDYSFSKPKDIFQKVTKQDVLNMTTSERAKFMIQNKLTRI